MKTPGDFYEWIGERRKAIRRLDIIVALAFILELGLLGGFLACFALRGKWEDLPSLIASLGSLLLTTALVYSNLKQRPALRFVGFSIEPRRLENKEHWSSLLEDKYRGVLNVYSLDKFPERVELPEVRPEKLKRFPYTIYEVKCKETPSKLRVANDLTNIGSVETNIHEYTAESSEGMARYTKGARIGLQTRITLDLMFPTNSDLHGGFYKLKITAIAATRQLSQSCWVWVSQDRKTIRWCAKKRPLEKLKIREN